MANQITLEREIYKASGVLIKGIPADGKCRKFKSGKKEWYAISFGDCGAFGCFSSNELFGWSATFNGGKSCRINPIANNAERLSRQQIIVEREIVALGNAAQDAGSPLQGEDADRYILALKRVIESNGER